MIESYPFLNYIYWIIGKSVVLWWIHTLLSVSQEHSTRSFLSGGFSQNTARLVALPSMFIIGQSVFLLEHIPGQNILIRNQGYNLHILHIFIFCIIGIFSIHFIINIYPSTFDRYPISSKGRQFIISTRSWFSNWHEETEIGPGSDKNDKPNAKIFQRRQMGQNDFFAGVVDH